MNAYHNLAGWLRDVRSVLGDRTELADSYYWQLRDLVEEVLELIEPEDDDGGNESDAEELEPADAPPDVAVQRPRDSRNAGSVGAATGASRRRPLGGAPALDDASPRSVRRGERDTNGVTAPLAGAGCQRMKPAEAIAPAERYVAQEVRSVPRGTQTPASSTGRSARTRKGVSRGKGNAKTKRRRAAR